MDGGFGFRGAGPGFLSPNGGPDFRGGLFPVYMRHGGGSHPLAWVIFGLLVVVLISVTVLLAAHFTGGPPRWKRLAFAGGAPEPLALLRMRYARGEIARDEFLQASMDLGAETEQGGKPPPKT
jgi:hypothetical protein